MASGNSLVLFSPRSGVPDATVPALHALRNGHPVIVFDRTSSKAILLTGEMPLHYGGGGVTVTLRWTADATTGTVAWSVAFERMSDGTTDIDSDSFATAQVTSAVTVPSTSGVIGVCTVAISDGANMDGVTAGDLFRLNVQRGLGTDTATGNVQLHSVSIKET